ncbi:monovalent cation:proton antiporter-2 (CPA2) family protein [Piscinibacter sakaiensis]|uniref:monovalent cation:proton antiporter-2 (CPA2) family protein n=1 Tax=Piscinibacter sakaiensis TaxID=1547922 RepID=UPI00372CBEFE
MAGAANDLVPTVALLGAAVLAVPLFKRLGLGSVLGYLAAGVVVGPFGLRLVEDPQTMLHVAELGVVMFLFIIGLEMRPAHLWQMKGQIFGLGSMQVAVALALMWAAGQWLGLGGPQAFVAAAGFVLTSTAIVMQLLQERRQLGTPGGERVVSILLFEDLLIVPLLAIVAFLAPDARSAGWTQRALDAGLALGAIAALLAAGRWLLNPMFLLLSSAKSREVMMAAALLVVLGAALWMQLGGLSAAMGAFLAGVMLAESSFRHQLEADIEPFKGLLLGLFFLAVGMSLDLTVLAAQWQTIALLVAAYMLLKSAAIYGVARLFRASGEQALQRTVLMAQGGEFAFVLYAAAASAGVIDASSQAVYTAVVIVSMVLTPVLIGLHGAWEARRTRRKLDDDRAMDTEMEHSPVIIAGFGRYGQIVGRLLLSNGITPTVMDRDSRHIEDMKPFGFRVYYGDATRTDLLRAAGAEHARVLVVAVDDRDDAVHIVEHARALFPQLHIVARAYDVPHLYRLMAAGADQPVRELLDGSLTAGRQVLQGLGLGAYESRELAEQFRQTNLRQVAEFGELRQRMPRPDFIQALRASREELERQLRASSACRSCRARRH